MTEPILTKADIHAAWRESGAISSSPPDWALNFARGIESRCRTTPDREAWISVEDRLPEEGQAIAFVVHWPGDEFLHGRVLGGTFHSYGGKMPTFSVPGTGFKATHWMPLPTAPNGEKK